MNYYVSPRGSDHAPGTRSQPWRTLERAGQTALTPGDHLWLEGGQTFPGSLKLHGTGTSEKPVTLGSYGQGAATIAAGTGTAVRAENLAGLEIRALRVEGDGPQVSKGSGIRVVNTLPGAVKLAHIRIVAVTARGFGREGIFVGGEPKDGSQSGFRDVRISGCEAHENAYFGIYVSGVWDTRAAGYANENVEIQDCRVWDNPGAPKYLENHSGSGILLDDVDGGQILRCRAWNNGALCNCPVGGPVGIWAHAANRVVIAHCESVGNRTGRSLDGGGFDFDGGVTNSVMEDNISRDNDGAGYLLYVYAHAPHSFHGNVVRRCRSEYDGRKGNYAGIYIGNDGSGVHDLTVENNTVITGSSAANLGATPKAVLVRGAQRLMFRGNTFETHGGVPLLDIAEDASALTFQGNVYRASGGAFALRWAGKTYASLAEWQAATGQEPPQVAR